MTIMSNQAYGVRDQGAVKAVGLYLGTLGGECN